MSLFIWFEKLYGTLLLDFFKLWRKIHLITQRMVCWVLQLIYFFSRWVTPTYVGVFIIYIHLTSCILFLSSFVLQSFTFYDKNRSKNFNEHISLLEYRHQEDKYPIIALNHNKTFNLFFQQFVDSSANIW